VRCSSAATRTPVSGTDALEGKWEVQYTRSEFDAAGADPSEDLPVNWGHFTLVFDHGRWWSIGRKPGSSAAGTYAVSGSKITFYRDDHAYPGSNTEVWGPYVWSVYRDTLTFSKPASFAGGPTELVVKPWRKAGGT
jgi:hypothetical protein